MANLEDNLTALKELAASNYVWSLLWKMNQSTHTELKVLDTVLLNKHKENGVCGWLFTSAEGIVKNKLQKRWNFHGIVDRIRNNKDGAPLDLIGTASSPSSSFYAHFFDHHSSKWCSLPSKEQLKHLLYPSEVDEEREAEQDEEEDEEEEEEKHRQKRQQKQQHNNDLNVLVLFPHIATSALYSYAELSYEIDHTKYLKGHGVIAQPKMQTVLLVDGKVKSLVKVHGGSSDKNTRSKRRIQERDERAAKKFDDAFPPGKMMKQL